MFFIFNNLRIENRVVFNDDNGRIVSSWNQIEIIDKCRQTSIRTKFHFNTILCPITFDYLNRATQTEKFPIPQIIIIIRIMFFK